MLFCVDLFFYQIISQLLLGIPICLACRHKCYFSLIGSELFIVKYFPAAFSLIRIKLSEISPKLTRFALLKMTHNNHTFIHPTYFQTWVSQGGKKSEI